ncbi:MAG: hypothetical protein WBK91_05540 [Alphaproteobacteria bacterium]
MSQLQTVNLLNGATAIGAGTAFVFHDNASLENRDRIPLSIQANVVGTGAVSATVPIYVSHDNANWLLLGTITLSGTAAASDGFVAAGRWAYMRADISAMSGVGAAVTVIVGV